MMRWAAAICILVAATEACGAEATVLKTRKDMVSYGIGVNIAKSFKKDEVEFDVNLITRGLKDGMSGKKLLMSERELRRVLNDFQAELRKKEMLNHRVAAEDNRKKGEAFLAENRTRDGVVALPSGVQYRVINAGEGRRPSDGDMVECNYRGTLLDGTEFDATEAGKPATLKVSQLIEGWKEALKLMPEGSKWQIFIPSQLAYGPRGVGSDIGPNETLVFEVDLVAVK
jgi:FKBP-type peptidyl-prolyl cis-trans isomerase FklB